MNRITLLLAGVFGVLAGAPVIVLAQAQGISYTLISRLNATSFAELLTDILRIFITVATPIVVLFIIFAGFQYVTARGNATKVQQATQAITYALIGGLLILGAVAIAAMITNVVNSISG